MELKENLVKLNKNKFTRHKTIMNYNEEDHEINFDENLVECFSKKKKNLESVNFIKKYLRDNMPKLVDSMSISKLDENEILTYISLHLKLEEIFKPGEKGEKYYFILKGEAEILVPKEIRVDLTFQEYSKYILSLKEHYEYELLYKCLTMNKSIFSIPDDFLVNLSSNGRKSILKSPSIRRSFLNETKENQNFFSEMFVRNKEASKLTIHWKDYINNLTPKISSDDYYERRTTRIYQYCHIVTLKIGDGFGDLALSNSNQKRYRVLDRKSYEYCLKEIKDKEKKILISFISLSPIFKSINKELMVKEFLNLFLEKKLRKKDKVISDGDEAKYIYIIKEGEYGVSMNKSLKEIDSMINHFCGEPAEHKRISFVIMKSEAFKEYVSLKRRCKILIVHEKDVIGFQNMVIEGKYCFDVECLSETGSLIQLDASILSSIYQTDQKILNDIEDYMNVKLAIINKRLNEIKLSKLDFFLEQEESRKLSIRNEKITTFKSKSVNKNYSISTNFQTNYNLTKYEETKSNEGIKYNREKDCEIPFRHKTSLYNQHFKDKEPKDLVGYSYLTIVSPKKNFPMNLSSTNVKIRTINKDLILKSNYQEGSIVKDKFTKPKKIAYTVEHENSSISKDKITVTEVKNSTKCDAETLTQSLTKINMKTISSSIYLNEVNHLDLFAYDKHYNKSPEKLPRLKMKSCENSLMNKRARLIYFSPSKMTCLNVYMNNSISDKNEESIKRLNSLSIKKAKNLKIKKKLNLSGAYNKY